MKKNAIKVISMLLAVAMLLSCGLVSAFAAEADYQILYGVESSTGMKANCYVTGYNGTLGDEGLLTFPAEISMGYFTIYLHRVEDKAFGFLNPTDTIAAKYSEEVKELVVPATIKSVGSQSFYNLANLEKVTFEGDIVIGEKAFANCKNLKTVVFNGKNVEVGASAFAGCTELADIRFENDVELLTGVNAFNDTKWFSAYPTDFIIAGTTLVAYVGNDAEVTLPLSITKIGNGAFKGNANLKTVNLTKNIVSLGDEAFMNCSALKTVNYSEYGNLDYIGVDVFTNTSYYDDFEGDFFCIEDRLIKYRGNDLYVEIPNTIREIAADAFMGCYTKSGDGSISYQVSSIRIPVSVEVCEDNCFAIYQKGDGTYFVPVLYVYRDTAAADLVAAEGYNYVELGVPGDVDIDKVVSAADARTALRIAVGLAEATPEELYMADIDGDLKVSAADARTILRIAVGLEEVDENVLLTKPSTPTEIVQYYAETLNRASKLQAGYTKKVSGSYAPRALTGNSEISIDLYSYAYLKGIAESDATVKNYSKAFESNTDAAAANLVACTLENTKAIKNATCVVSDGKYYINITMNTEEDIDSDTAVSDIYPVAGRNYYDSLLAGKSWFQNKNNWLTYDLFYKNCTVNVVVDIMTQEIESIDMGVTYFFDEIDGVINLMHVTNEGRTSGTGHATRYDAISFSNFVY
ncbi:MAG: leucine-rich repeat protein [Clostridia bacterium]|nr:leucine-rich repeat protein [Clostridia bacterium]